MQSSLSVGIEALRANPLRTLLSTLGVVMGVAAMVSVLSMGDGVERFAREEIERTTDLLAISVEPRTGMEVDGQFIRRPDVVHFSSADLPTLRNSIGGDIRLDLAVVGGVLVDLPGESEKRGFAVEAVQGSFATDNGLTLTAGEWFSDRDTAVVVLNSAAAGLVAGDSTQPQRALGRTIIMQNASYRVIGVLQTEGSSFRAFVPVDDASRAFGAARTPTLVVRAAKVEDVDPLRKRIENWAASAYGEQWGSRISVTSQQRRAEQATAGMTVFKILMGAITGVSLLVGGVGIMNVMLASVAERTREIGIRKATGATNREIMLQFLTESVAITSAGAVVGVVLGLLISMAAAGLMRAQVGAGVHSAITFSTILFAVGAAIVVGMVFGLYPARRAARLSPIEAIRHE